MRIDYIKMDPTGNTTVLVKTPVPRTRQAALAARLLGDGGVGGEQVGYIEPARDPRARARLQMMGGEFCGNATMSLGALLAREAGLAAGETAEYTFEVSGSDDLVPCRVRRDGDGWAGDVRMPLPTAIREVALETDGGVLNVPLVELPGIAHLILPADAGLDEAFLRAHMPELCRRLSADALGALTWDAANVWLDPLVYVPSAGTLVREHGCGSGSAAIGCWLTARAGHSLETAVRQPGGTIVVRAEMKSGAPFAVTIRGRVALLEEGTTTVCEEEG